MNFADVKRNDLLLWKHVVKTDGCWLWQGKTMNSGYGQLTFLLSDGTRKYWGTHQAALSLSLGRLLVKHALHTCDTKTCVNPAHLYEGTQKQNVGDCMARGRHIAPRGEKCGTAKLTEKQVIAIVSARETHRVLSERYGVSCAQISRIKNGKRWAHV